MAFETFKQRLQILDFVCKQYESDKNELANNLLKFNEIVGSFEENRSILYDKGGVYETVFYPCRGNIVSMFILFRMLLYLI